MKNGFQHVGHTGRPTRKGAQNPPVMGARKVLNTRMLVCGTNLTQKKTHKYPTIHQFHCRMNCLLQYDEKALGEFCVKKWGHICPMGVAMQISNELSPRLRKNKKQKGI